MKYKYLIFTPLIFISALGIFFAGKQSCRIASKNSSEIYSDIAHETNFERRRAILPSETEEFARVLLYVWHDAAEVIQNLCRDEKKLKKANLEELKIYWAKKYTKNKVLLKNRLHILRSNKLNNQINKDLVTRMAHALDEMLKSSEEHIQCLASKEPNVVLMTQQETEILEQFTEIKKIVEEFNSKVLSGNIYLSDEDKNNLKMDLEYLFPKEIINSQNALDKYIKDEKSCENESFTVSETMCLLMHPDVYIKSDQ